MTIVNGGGGYTVGDIINVTSGVGGQVQATTVITGNVIAVAVVTPGDDYQTGEVSATTGGSGTGLLLLIGAERLQTVRQRTIQHQRSTSATYPGPIWSTTPVQTLSQWNRKTLSRFADYWATVLTAGDRSNWDAVAGAYPNGFEAYMAVQKTTIFEVTSPDDGGTWDGVPPFPLSTGFATSDITIIGVIREQPGTAPDALQLRIDIASPGTFDRILISCNFTGQSPRGTSGRTVLQCGIQPLVTPGPVGLPCWQYGHAFFGDVVRGAWTIYLRPYNSLSGLVAIQRFPLSVAEW